MVGFCFHIISTLFFGGRFADEGEDEDGDKADAEADEYADFRLARVSYGGADGGEE